MRPGLSYSAACRIIRPCISPTPAPACGFREIPEIKPGDFVWPDLESPERAAIWAADPMIGREEALEIALSAEQAGLAYYKSVLDATDDPEIKKFWRPNSSQRKASMLPN